MKKSFSDKQVFCEHLIYSIRENMRENDFQRDFFESLADQFEAGRKLSDKQMECLNKIYERVTS